MSATRGTAPRPGLGRRLRWLVWPPSRGFPPVTRRDWIPHLAVLAVTGTGIAAGLVTPWLASHLPCRPGLLPSGQVYRQGGDCVGTSDGGSDFGLPEFAPVMRQIAAQNTAAGQDPCGTGAAPVVVGVLMTMNAPGVGGRAAHQLEGIAAAQARGNRPGCIHPIRLRVGQIGADGQAATEVAARLADAPDLVAVVGMGLSDQRSADAAEVLAAARVPMVAAVITAEGFDQNGSRDDNPDYRNCDPAATYVDGVAPGFFYRVSYRVAVQIDQLAGYFAQTPNRRLDFVVAPTDTSDPASCTTLPLVHRAFGARVPRILFDPDDPTTVDQTAQRICAADGAVTVFFAARPRDLPRFLHRLHQESDRGICRASAVTVLSSSDASRLRAPEVEPTLEQIRVEALTSRAFRTGRIQLIYPPLADPAVLERTNRTGFNQLREAFTGAGFDLSHLDDGWAVNGYDALTTVAAAVGTLSASAPVRRSQVNTAISGFSAPDRAVPAASGTIAFDNNGNRLDFDGNGRPKARTPAVLRLCPMMDDTARPTTVEVFPPAGRCP